MFSFKAGTALAIQQDQGITTLLSGGTIPASQITEMENNAWVAAASKMAPGNLVIRQYALIDLAKGVMTNKDKIVNQLNLLTYKEIGPYLIWAEGYSYFRYTLDILNVWVSKFSQSDVQDTINKVRGGFQLTAYDGSNGLKYPAPFGDLRNEPLRPEDQINWKQSSTTVTNVSCSVEAGGTRYFIRGQPIGLNTHIPKDDSSVFVMGGIPAGFKFYEGYNKKYKNSFAEWLDTYSIKRLRSIP